MIQFCKSCHRFMMEENCFVLVMERQDTKCEKVKLGSFQIKRQDSQLNTGHQRWPTGSLNMLLEVMPNISSRCAYVMFAMRSQHKCEVNVNERC